MSTRGKQAKRERARLGSITIQQARELMADVLQRAVRRAHLALGPESTAALHELAAGRANHVRLLFECEGAYGCTAEQGLTVSLIEDDPEYNEVGDGLTPYAWQVLFAGVALSTAHPDGTAATVRYWQTLLNLAHKVLSAIDEMPLIADHAADHVDIPRWDARRFAEPEKTGPALKVTAAELVD
jgi:hypothetical protein